jgi:hypothetical protein
MSEVFEVAGIRVQLAAHEPSVSANFVASPNSFGMMAIDLPEEATAMRGPKVRISTLMLLVAVAALAVALLVERRRSAALLAEMRAERNRAQATAELAEYRERIAALGLIQARKDARSEIGPRPD